MKSIITIKLKIPFNKQVFDAMETYSECISYITNIGLENKAKSRYSLHHLAYYKAKARFNLKSQFIINAIGISYQTIKSLKSNKSKAKPVFKKQFPLSFDKRTFAFNPEKIRITTQDKRIDIPIVIPEYYWKYLDWSYQTAIITIDKKRRMFVHIAFSRDIAKAKGTNNIIGIDLGINNLAVASNKQFFAGNQVKTKMIMFKRLRAKLQAKGTSSSRRLLQKISGKEKRFKAWVNHNISRQIISSCSSGDTIVMENLRNIRRVKRGKRFNFWLNSWTFYQLQTFIQYKAIIKGIDVIKVSPYLTSKSCSRCNNTGSRRKGFFHCEHCGYSLNADLNASFNLAKCYSKPDSILVDVNQPNSACDDSKGNLFAIADEHSANAQQFSAE